MEGVLELHWERQPWGELAMTLFAVEAHGQRRYVDSFLSEPFGGALEAAGWVTRTLLHEEVTQPR